MRMEEKENEVGSELDQERQCKEIWTPSAGDGEGGQILFKRM